MGWFYFLFAANIVIAVMLISLLTAYMVRYYWWQSRAGQAVVSSLTTAIIVVSGGICERFGWMLAHNILVSVGYTGGAVLLFLMTRHIIKLKNGPAEAVPHRDTESGAGHD